MLKQKHIRDIHVFHFITQWFLKPLLHFITPYHTTMVLNKQLLTKKQKRKEQLFIFPWIGSDPR